MWRSILSAIVLAFISTTCWGVEFKNVQPSHGQLGPKREDLKYRPGDEVYVRYTLEKMTSDAAGKMNGEMNVKLVDANGKQILDQTFPMAGVIVFGGGTVPSYASVILGERMPAGDYSMTVTVTDNIAKSKDSFTQKFEVIERDFAITAVRFYHDKIGRVPAPAGGIVSQTVFVKFRAVGFAVGDGFIDLPMEVQIYDSDGKKMMPKPIAVAFHEEDPERLKLGIAAFDLEFTLNRPGEFKMEIKVKDTVSGKTAKIEMPLRVIDRLP